MKIINIQAAKTHLSRIVDQVVDGQEIVLGKAGKPLVKLVPYEMPRKPRTPGLFAGRGWESEDAWEKEADPLHVDAPMFHGAVEEPPPAR
jgi:prevent-host-death family protein